MARPLRVDIEGGWYYVVSRGIERRAIFEDDQDRWDFLDLLTALPQRFRVAVHAYVCMETHYHLILETPDTNLSRALQWLNVSYSAWFNTRHGRVGPLFQGRFKSVLIEGAEWAYELSVYVHLNPLRIAAFGLSKRARAGAASGQGTEASAATLKARLSELRRYRWSSYRAYAGYVGCPAWLTRATILDRASRTPDKQEQAYRQYVRQRLVEGADPDTLDRIRDRLAIGTATFVTRVKRGLRTFDRETDAKKALRRRFAFADIVEVVEQVRGESWDALTSRYADPGRWQVLTLAREYTGMTLSELGQAVGGMDYAAVGMGIRRFARRLSRDRQQSKAMDKMRKMLDVKT